MRERSAGDVTEVRRARCSLSALILVVLAYLAGSIPFGVLVARLIGRPGSAASRLGADRRDQRAAGARSQVGRRGGRRRHPQGRRAGARGALARDGRRPGRRGRCAGWRPWSARRVRSSWASAAGAASDRRRHDAGDPAARRVPRRAGLLPRDPGHALRVAGLAPRLGGHVPGDAAHLPGRRTRPAGLPRLRGDRGRCSSGSPTPTTSTACSTAPSASSTCASSAGGSIPGRESAGDPTTRSERFGPGRAGSSGWSAAAHARDAPRRLAVSPALV